MFRIYHTNEKEAKRKKRGQIKSNTHAENKRWVVERTNSWHNRFRKLFTRYERRLRTTLDWCNYQTVSLSIDRYFWDRLLVIIFSCSCM
jgi:transposase